MLFNTIELEHDGEWVTIKGVSSAQFISDIRRIYRFSFDQDNLNKIKLFFNISQSGMIFKKVSFSVHQYFLLDMYSIFERLYSITDRSMYKELMELLLKEPQVAKYFTPNLPLPSEVTNRLNQLSIKLYDFQMGFIDSYYQAKAKLGLHGYLLSFLAGGGKTLTSLAAIYAFNLMPCVIIAPRSTLDGWYTSILRLIPSIKEEEIKLSYNYNPSKDKIKWKFFIGNYERIDQALQCSPYADGPVKSLCVDESHNFRNVNTVRTQSLLHFKEATGIEDVICISATPIKAKSAELIPIMQLIDPNFNETAQEIFRSIYSKNRYDNISGSVLKNRLSTYMERRTLEESGLKLPPKERYEVKVRLSDSNPYLIDTMKSNVWKYVKDTRNDYMALVKPAFDHLMNDLLKRPQITQNIDGKKIQSYMDAVSSRYKNPFNKDDQYTINHFEKDLVKPIDPKIFKEINTTRKKITSWMMIQLGKALGIFFIKKKIELIATMVKENINEIIKIIQQPDMKTVIFATYIEPLVAVKDTLESQGIGCILHTGNDDIEVNRKIFKEDDKIQVLLGTTSSIGTGVDGLQMIADKMILLNTPYRSSDLVQIEARIERQGSPAKSIKIYYMKLDTGNDPNILDSETEIVEWSRNLLRLAMD